MPTFPIKPKGKDPVIAEAGPGPLPAPQEAGSSSSADVPPQQKGDEDPVSQGTDTDVPIGELL